MGGTGSGWQRERKITVEEGLILVIKDLAANGVLVPGAYRSGSLTWQCDGSKFEYGSELSQDGTGSLFLRCVGPGQQFCHWVSLCSTVPHYGGRRWWFICPIKKIRFRNCTCRQARPRLPAARRTISPIAPPRRAGAERDQKSFGVAWPSDSAVTPNPAGGARSITPEWPFALAVEDAYVES